MSTPKHPRIKKSDALAFAKAFDELFQAAGAIPVSYGTGPDDFRWEMDTPAGPWIIYRGDMDLAMPGKPFKGEQSYHLHSRFDDLAKAQSSSAVGCYMRGSYSGKWNHYFPVENGWQSAIDDVRRLINLATGNFNPATRWYPPVSAQA